MKMSHIFIAHVEEDADAALEIAAGLEKAGYKTWTYEIDSIPGPSYLLQTAQAIVDSAAVLVLISPHSLSSRQISREVIRAHESGKDFIPILQNISHVEFQNRQPEWREAIGAAASTSIPRDGVTPIIPRIIDGLRLMGIEPGREPDTAKISQIGEIQAGLQSGGTIVIDNAAVRETGKPEPFAGEAAEKTGIRWKKWTAIASGVIIVAAVITVVLVNTLGKSPETAALYEEAEILFSEDFESGVLSTLSKNPPFVEAGGTATIEEQGGNHFLNCTDMLCSTSDDTWTDYILGTKFAIISNEAFLRFRFSRDIEDGNTVFNGYEVTLTPTLCILQKNHFGMNIETKITELTSAMINIEPGTWHDLTVTCQENRFAVDIDGKRILGYIDKNEPVSDKGNISVGTNAGIAMFDDIEVRVIPADYTLKISESGNVPASATIPDENLKAAIESALGKSPGTDLTMTDLTRLTDLNAERKGISDITGIEYFSNLSSVHILRNQIADITPLSSLTGITSLNLADNQLSDISAVSSLKKLNWFHCWGNRISDVKPLSGLTELRVLHLNSNLIRDISPLSTLTKLVELVVSGNNITDIEALSPLTELDYLELSANRIEDISALSGLKKLTILNLSGNSLSDISPLSSLTNLKELKLEYTNVSDIKPLVENSGLSEGDIIYLTGSPLSAESLSKYVTQLKDRGVTVYLD